MSPLGSKSSGLSRLHIVILIFLLSASRIQAIGVPHSWQKNRAPCEDEINSLGSPFVYSKQDNGIAIQETKAAPEIRLHIEQWQFAEG